MSTDKYTWTQEDHDRIKKELRSLPEPTKVKLVGVIREAVFHPERGFIGVQLALPDGTLRAAYIHKSSCLFFGKHWTEIPASEVDREMEKTANLFREARGRRIKLEIGEDQARMD